MEPQKQNNTALDSAFKPEFFKVLFPDPFANLMIPRKFHVKYLRHNLQQVATLFNTSGEYWQVEISITGQDIYFQKGWSEFAKAHELRIGYFMVFQYEGNMIFKFKIFDTSGCLTDYSPASHAHLASPYIETGSSSETGDQTQSKSSHDFKSVEIDKRKRGTTSQETLKEKKDRKEKNVESNRQLESILRPYCFSNPFLYIPKKFCVNNGLLTRRTMYLKENSSGGRSWPVSFCLRTNGGQLNKGWKKFREAAGLKEGDRCIFRLKSRNFLVVTVIPQEINSTRGRKGKATEGSTSSAVTLEKKQIQQNRQYSRPTLS